MDRSRSPDDDQSVAEDADGRRQANRACDWCHRMKMKCIGKEDPPCRRCRQTGHPCTFDGPRKSKSSRVEDRLRLVETQMGSMQSSLEELLKLQRAAALPTATSHPVVSDVRSVPPQQGVYMGREFTSPHNAMPVDPYLSQITPGQHPGHHHAPQPPVDPYGHDQQHWPPSGSKRPRSAKAASAAPSDDEDADPITNNTMRDWDNMFYLAEAARLEQDGHLAPSDNAAEPSLLPPGHGRGQSAPSEVARKRRRSTKPIPGDEFAELKRNLPLQRGDHVSRFKDCIDMGYCDVPTAKRMFDNFMQGSLVYMPCFDSEVDTFESLRKRSPMALTVLVMVGAKVADAGGPVSDLQRKCKEHAEHIGMSTLFSPVARIEVVQAMIVLASWGDTSWRPGGHALRMAMDMGLYRCLPLLAQTGMGKGKTAEELKEEYQLVVGARVWLTLYKMEFEMAFNLGRPALFAGEETIRYSHEFLSHPLAVATDSRLVATCELLTARAPLHQPFAIIPDPSRIPDLDEKLQRYDQVADEWFRYWDKYYESKGIGPNELFRETLITARSGAELFTNSRVLHGVRNKEDVARMPEHRRRRLIKARNAAETLISMCLRSEQYTQNFHYANLYTHLHIAFAARVLIRLVSLIPEGANTRQIGRDVEKIAQVLTSVPGFQYATYLREVLGRARRHKVLPPLSKPPSPARRPRSLIPMSSTLEQVSSSAGGSDGSPTFNFSFSPAEGQPFDFGYAEQLFAQPRADVPQNFLDLNIAPSHGYNLESWFPFPPLETDGNNGNVDPGLTGGPLENHKGQTWW